jgi:T5SS/PEP-CTERM-associated repeat protein
VLVTGAGSLWTNRNDVYVGRDGGRNSLFIGNGAAVYDINASIGYNSTAASNTAVVSGTGAFWSTSFSFYVGNSGASNSLVISNHGLVSSLHSYIGYNSTASNCSVFVTDPGSVWSNNFDFYLGYSSPGNSLVISNGGRMINAPQGGNGDFIGYNPGSNSNRVLATGSGSVWSNSSSGLTVGFRGCGNSVIISNGGQAFNAGVSGVSVGGASCSNNTVIVTGSNSTWKIFYTLRCGFNNRGNRLVISDGGKIVDADGRVGSGTSGNAALVTGNGSVWSNTTLAVGSLVISNGGLVVDNVGTIGEDSTSSNSVRVNSNALWQSSVLVVGDSGASNSLIVAGGTVRATNLVIGLNSPTCDNFVELNSGSVYVTDATGDAVLEVRNGTFILNGGTLQADTLVMTNACGLFVRNGGTLIVGNLVLDPTLSALGDGIPNGWKQWYGLDPFDPNLANEDPDGVGFNNLQEYLAGFNPTNPAAYLHVISIATTNATDIDVTYLGANGDSTYVPGIASCTNVLEFTTGSADGSYSANNFASTGQTNILSGGTGLGIVTNMTDFGGATNGPSRYYRVRVLAP